ncbi:uncharacterized protein LOC117337834 [Pecten maximus]|uniref:uncharacterized protein LOC117337834 n=1 Tax=Pecten maximus TaxID=6579 RepID=UPI0014586381|nr:uncharacterized protein LOC117337834 [Pecten maximus]
MASKKSIFHTQFPIRVKGDTKCNNHKDNDVFFLCQNCQTLICPICSITEHKLHIDSFVELSKFKIENGNLIQNFVDETDNVSIPKLKQEIISSRTKQSSCKPLYDKLRTKITDNNNKCKIQLDEMTADYISICDRMEVADTELIQTHITDLERRLETFRELSSEYKQTLKTGTAVLMYDSVSEIREMDTDIPPTPDKQTYFTPGMDRQSHLKQALGNMNLPTDYLQAGSASGIHSDQRPVVRPKQSTEAGQASTGEVRYKLRDSPAVMSQFLYPDHIKSICPTSDGRAWLCDHNTDTVKLINKEGQVKQTITHNSNIQDISLDPTTGRLWFCCMDKRIIFEVSTSCTPVPRFTTEDFPYSLCVTREGRVAVGTVLSQGYTVVMYTVTGKVLHTQIVEESRKGYVLSISQCCVTGNIAMVSSKHISGVVSDTNNYRIHIIVYNPTLQPLFHYRGEGIPAQGEGIQSQEPVTLDKFDPITVVYDSKGNIVIADETRNTIELINGAGKYIKTLHTNKFHQGVVGIQKGDVLWSQLVLDTGQRGLKLLKYYSD